MMRPADWWMRLDRWHKIIVFLVAISTMFTSIFSVALASGWGPLSSPSDRITKLDSGVAQLNRRVGTLEGVVEYNRVERNQQLDEIRAQVRERTYPSLVDLCLNRTDRELKLMRLNCHRVFGDTN